MGILDDAAKDQSTPQATPATPTAAPTGATQGGSILEQAAAEQPSTAASSTVTPPPVESTLDRWKREAYETLGQAVPQAAVAPMQGLKTHILDKFQQSGRELGNIAENKVNSFIAAADDMMNEDLNDKRTAIPAYAKGLESEYLRQKFQTEAPVTAGVTGGVANLGGQILGDPTNWPFLAKGLVSQASKVSASAFKPWAEKLMSKGFGLQMSAGVVSQLDQLKDNWDKMSDYDKSHAITQVIAGTYMAQSAVREGFKGEPKAKVETPATVGPEAGGEGPRTSTQTGTVAGEANALRPTIRTTAGVEAPITAKSAATLEGQKPSILQRVADTFTTPGAETTFGKERTAPAATRQAVSTVGQVAEDRIAQHEAIVNGETPEEGITGTQQTSKFTSPDEAWQEMQRTAQNTTFRKADEISQREQAAWEAKRDEAHQDYKDLVDRHNKNIDDYNAQVPKDQQMPHAVADLNEVAVPDRPQTYNELRSDVQTEQANARSQDAAVREEAIKTGLPKAEKAMDNWFKQHSDEVSPAEYDSVRKLWADSERMKEIAMGLRGPLTKGNLTGNQMRQIEVSMNNRQLRRGQSPDAFQRLLGTDGYNNWQNVAKLFDTVKDPTLPEQFQSWGKYAGEYLVSALIPHILGSGIAAKWGMEKLLNHVMFDPEFGSTFGKVVDWLKSQHGRVVDSIKELPTTLRDQMTNIIKAYKDAGEQGAVGRNIKKPVKRLGGAKPAPAVAPATPEETQVAAHEANGGSTFTPEGQNLAGQNTYSVAAYPGRTQQLDNLTPDALQAFKDQNKDVLSQPNHAVGTWKDTDTGKHVLDVAKLYGDRGEAVSAGQAANQKAIYHLGRNELIPTGGTGEVPSVNNVVNDYNASQGKPEVSSVKTPVDPRTADKIADEYDKLKHSPNNPKVKKAYSALIKETKDQWHALEKAGYRLQVESQDPYGLDSSKPAYQEMSEDVKNNKRIKVWDGGKPPADHPLSGIDPETGVSYNTLFRAVHDVMGHVAGDNDFSQQGEENAYQRHAQSYSKDAIPALTTETRGQTSHYFNNEKVRNGGEHSFVDQRAALLPERFYAKGTESQSTPISDSLVSKYGTTDDARKAAFVLPDGRMVELSGEHDQMVTNAAKAAGVKDLPKPTDANGQIGPREHIIASENAIRTRYRQTKGGKEIVFSIPDKITDAQAQQLRMATAKIPNGSVVIEQGKPGGSYKQIDATPGNVQAALEDLGARPKGEAVAEAQAKADAERARQAAAPAPEPIPQPVYVNRHNGVHEVVTGPADDRTGYLLAMDVPSEKEGEPSTEVRVTSHTVDPEKQGKGVGSSQIETLAKELPSDKTAVLSDLPNKMTDAAKGSWKRLMRQYPIAVTEEADGGYRFDLEKLRSPAVERTTVSPKGSTVQLMSNPLPVKTVGSDTPSTLDVAMALNKYTKRNLGALQPGSEPAEMVERAKSLAEDEARYQLGTSNSGTTWYTEQMDEHDAVAKEMRPELKDDTKLSIFKFAEAVLSSGQKPYRNFTATMEAWDHYAKDGKFPSTNPSTGKSWGPRGIAAYGNAFESINRLIEEKGEKGAVDWMMGDHPTTELKEYNKNVSGKKTDLQPGVMILGAKRGPFAQNLHGMETAFTADMWVSRTWNRWMGTIEVADDGEISSDAPRNQQERSLMKQSFSEVAQKLGLTTSSLQAVLWYYEQALYTAHGTPKESWSFSDAARRAQAEAKAKAPAAAEPETPATGFGPRERAGQYKDKETEFNPDEL